jgi:hypothetical protein
MSTDPNFINFVGLSSILTGYSEDQLAPPIDPIGLASEYLNWMLQHADQAAFLQTLSTYQAIAAQFPPADRPAQVQLQILDTAGLGDIARRLIRLWYLSTWYATEPPAPFGAGQVVSMNAYTMGLAWDAAQAHPMGFSELHFGYWAMPPPPNDVSPNAFPQINTSTAPASGSPKVAMRISLQRGGI